MLYSSYRGAGGTFRGKTWKLPNGYWRACNYNGQQCTFKMYNEALKFSNKGKKLNEVSSTSTRLRSILGHNLRFKLVDKAPPKVADKMPDRGWDIWVGGANVVATNANAWQAWTVDGRKLGSGRDLQFDPSILEGHLQEAKEITLQAVRTRREAEQMANHSKNMSGVISTSVKELSNGQFQPVLVMKEGYQSAGARMQSHYMPELSRREMSYLASNLVKQGYNVNVKGPNLVTDAPEEQIQASFGPGINEARSRTHYLPGLNRRMMSDLGGELVRKGYKVKIKGPNLSTDSPEKIITRIVNDFSTGGGQYDWRVSSKREEEVVDEAKSSFTLHAMGNGWSHSKTISASSQKEAENMFRQDPRFRKEARRAGEKWKEVPIVGDREARSKFGKVKKTQEPDMGRSAFLSRTKGPPRTEPQHYAPVPSKRRGR